MGRGERGLRQSERDAYEAIMEFLQQEQMCEFSKLSFLRAVETLSGVVRAQADGNMNDYCSKNALAKKIKMLILEESFEILDSSVRQQAMLCIVALSQVNPPFHLSQKLDLVNVAVASVFSLPLIVPSLDRKESASLYLQTVQALDDMLHVLVMDKLDPDMLILQHFLEILLPWVTMSDKVHEQTRALGTITRLLRFICNFPKLSHMQEFSVTGTLMGLWGLFCLHSNPEISQGASEALHYLFKILVLQRSVKQKTESILKDLQKHFRGEWLASMQTLTWFFRKYLTPDERADVFIVALEALVSSRSADICAASRMLKMILKDSLPEIGKVPEIIQYIYYHMNSITEATAQKIVKKILHLLAQSYTDDVILTLFKIEDQSQKGVRKPWEILASFPKGYEVIMEHLLQRLIPNKYQDLEPSSHTVISPLIATRAIHELLLEPSRRMEVQSFFSPLFVALLCQVSFLVVEGCAEAMQDQQHVTNWVDPVSSTVEALKTLMRCSGYADHVTYIRKLGGWELLVNPERHYDGVTLLARSLVVMNCWHNCPVFSHIVRLLQDLECVSHLTALVFLVELLQCPEVAAIVDDITTHILASWFKYEQPSTLKVLLHMAEVFGRHPTTERRFRILQPHVLNCCYSTNGDIVTETLQVLNRLLQHLTWEVSSSFLIQLSFTLVPFFEEESEHLRLMAFEVYSSLLAKVKRSALVFPLRHQVVNLLVLLVLHLKDESLNVAQVSRLALSHTVMLLHWSRLRLVVAEEDEFTILRALLQHQASKALWFLKQSVALFRSPQAAIRQAAIWFAGQIMQTLDMDEEEELEDAYAALRSMRRDPDPMVSCLTTQTLYILEANRKLSQAKTSTSCFCRGRPRRGRL
ncbi:maestro heat-like repeat-containing protein family member 7 [Ochotona curzoniae]|uniref:maestro heat-like repeat-containing protein family member 7 n=1 Tax=Ochotona curzoniae TaxID=130825 RepID=UPI001B34D7AF|nr:maestro heat-like repeat-containing protein family member 7 [Ochotona curzoniae]